MLLATRCPSCHTVFRVVADQLKLRGGLVRCGNCKQIFNAQAHLCDDPDATAAAAPPVTDEAIAAQIAAAASADTSQRESLPEPVEIADIHSPTFSGIGKPDTEPAEPPAETITDTITANPLNAVPAQALLRHADESDASLDTPSDTVTTPRRPRQPRVMLWRTGAGILLVIALAQTAWLRRDAIVGHWGALYTPVQRICGWSGCTMMPPREIDALAIESSNLSRDTSADDTSGGTGDMAAGAQALTLTIFLRNKADNPVAFPALELTLSDEQSQPVVRRVFRPADYAPHSELIKGLTPHTERVIRLRLMSTVAVAANYRVAALYP